MTIFVNFAIFWDLLSKRVICDKWLLVIRTTDVVNSITTNTIDTNLITVNDTYMTSMTHDEAINVLRNAGSEVHLTVKHYKSAAPFLLKNVRQLIPDLEPTSPPELGMISHKMSIITILNNKQF